MGFEEFRNLFPVLKDKVWLNHASFSPLPLPTEEAYRRCLNGMLQGDYWFTRRVEESRRLFARLIGCSPEEVALMPNTSYGIAAVSTGLRFKPGANVVTTDLEFPSVVYTWLVLERRGLIEVRFVRSVNGAVRIEDFEKAVDDDTVIVSVSHVEFQSGWRNDLKAICEIAHEHGAYVLDDAIQAVGAVKVDVKADGIDFLAAGGYKWLLSPGGTGFLYVRRSLIKELETPVVGSLSAKPELVKR
ncbi:MAG TPA: aminotransferase class V-fold PLP-dependent enzyme, partial [Armatimonadetes bacterium]|nr:aminotransferase class V-fold PLP-dependent enzyme [Armatimonadota bacterium]